MNLKLNQIITHTRGSKRKVLEVGENTVVLSYKGNFDLAHTHFTEKELIDNGWIIPVEAWEPKEDEDYFYLSIEGEILRDIWSSHRLDYSRKNNLFGIYPSQKSALKALEEIKIKLKK